MKPLFRIFELSRNEQRVVLIAILILIAIALVEYERRIHDSSAQLTSATDSKTSPTPVETGNELTR
jgi:hypothetical protein